MSGIVWELLELNKDGGMNLVPIGEICDLRNGRAFKPTEWSTSGTPIIRIQNLTDETKPFNYCNFEVDRKFHVENGNLLFSWSGTPGTSFGAFFWRRERGYLNQHIFRIDPYHPEDLHLEYFRLALNQKLEEIISHAHGGVGLQHITKEKLKKVKVYLPQLHDQIRIAHLLGKVEGLIAQRKQHLQQLDDLLKSVFLEMFGPNCADYDAWPLVEIRDLAAKHKGAMRTGPFGSNLLHSEFTIEGDVAVLGIDNAVHNCFTWGERRFISNEKYKELQSYRIFPGDVIVTIMGTVGRSAVIPSDIPLAINTKHLAAITLNRDIADPIFLSYSIHSSPFIQRQFVSKNRGAIMYGLNLGIIKETKIKLPRIELQNQFAKLHGHVDSLKTHYQKSLSDLKALYGALSKQAFKGELDLSLINSTEQYTEPQKPIAETQALQHVEEQNHPNTLLLATSEGRLILFRKIFEKAINELNYGDRFDLDLFWMDAHGVALDYVDENSGTFGISEYEQLKTWIFDMLNSGQLTQMIDEFWGLSLFK